MTVERPANGGGGGGGDTSGGGFRIFNLLRRWWSGRQRPLVLLMGWLAFYNSGLVTWFWRWPSSSTTTTTFYKQPNDDRSAEPILAIDHLQEEPLSLYGNLSCPFEWSKFSCSHQRRWAQAERGRALVLATLRSEDRQRRLRPTPSPLSLPLPQDVPPKKTLLLLVGDSTMRQIFIALGCYFWQHRTLRDYTVDWERVGAWPCHGTPHCISHGNHSGFNTGHFTTTVPLHDTTTTSSSSSSSSSLRLLQVFFLPIGGSDQRYLQENIIAQWHHELVATGRISFSLPPTMPHVYPLTGHDTIVYNMGLHMKDRTNLYRTVDAFGRRLLTLQKLPTQPSDGGGRPTLVYMNTITQHFPTTDGRYVEHAMMTMMEAAAMMTTTTTTGDAPSLLYQCPANVSINPLLDQERSMIRAGVNADFIFSPNDETLGLYHVGGIDCTHYCMPGPPDVFAHRLLHHFIAL